MILCWVISISSEFFYFCPIFHTFSQKSTRRGQPRRLLSQKPPGVERKVSPFWWLRLRHMSKLRKCRIFGFTPHPLSPCSRVFGHMIPIFDRIQKFVPLSPKFGHRWLKKSKKIASRVLSIRRRVILTIQWLKFLHSGQVISRQPLGVEGSVSSFRKEDNKG